MITRLKTALARESLIKIMNMGKECKCMECIHASMKNNLITLYCHKINLPCCVLKGKFTSSKKFISLIAEKDLLGCIGDEKKLLETEYDEHLVNKRFFNSAVNHYIEREDIINGKTTNDT